MGLMVPIRLMTIMGLGAVGAFAGVGLQAPASLPFGTTVRVVLQTRLDTTKAVVGDSITAKVSGNVTSNHVLLIAKDSLLVGRITRVIPADGKKPAQLGVLFDQIRPKNGVPVELRAAIVRVYPDGAPKPMPVTPIDSGALLITGSGSVYLPPDGTETSLNHSSDGIAIQFALQDQSADPQTDLGGVISSVSENFKLEKGTKILVRVLFPSR